jgi:four helix bundle protein
MHRDADLRRSRLVIASAEKGMRHFKELRVWQRAHALALDVYGLTEGFPATERFGLVSQLRRAAVSVASNVAEGSRRVGSRDYARFLNIAEGSAAETEYLILLSRDLGHLPAPQAENALRCVSDISNMLLALRTRVHEAHKN